MKTFFVSSGGRELTVRLGPDGEVTVDGRPCSVRRLSGTEFSVIAGNRQVRVAAAGDGSAFGAIAGGFHRTVDVETERERLLRRYGRSTMSGGTRLELHAPMPAMVVRIDVAVGDQVRRSQPLIVLEAMKMENELISPGEGCVKEIHAKIGKPVEKGELLIRLE